MTAINFKSAMKYIPVIASMLLSLHSAHGKVTAEPKLSAVHEKEKVSATTANQNKVSIHVADGNWGNVSPKEIETVLNAAATEMLARFPGRHLAPIEVRATNHRPVVLYQKGPANQYLVYLAAKDRHWGEYIYEFSHELFHILSNYEYHPPAGHARHQWFEEMMCEAASLYTLKRLSLVWKESVPVSAWTSYAPVLEKFTHRALSEPHRRLPANTSLAEWFQEHEHTLLGNPYLRAKNEMVAMRFLPLLERSADWNAVGFLNPPVHQNATTFFDHLADWYDNTPATNRDLVVHAMNLFGFHLPVADARASTLRQQQAKMTVPLDAASEADLVGPEAGAAGAAGFTRHHTDR